MTREEAIQRFNGIINAMSISIAQSKFYPSKAELDELCDMAIEALQFTKHFDLLKEFQSLQEVVLCKDCIHQEHCYKTVAHTRHHDDFIEHWSETIEWCSRGERKGGEDE
jgi:hypothetical protein